jgi:hypothetical protein
MTVGEALDTIEARIQRVSDVHGSDDCLCVRAAFSAHLSPRLTMRPHSKPDHWMRLRCANFRGVMSNFGASPGRWLAEAAFQIRPSRRYFQIRLRDSDARENKIKEIYEGLLGETQAELPLRRYGPMCQRGSESPDAALLILMLSARLARQICQSRA